MYKQMKSLLRKLLVIIVLFAPLFVNTDCKKQKRCGCRGDALYDYESRFEDQVHFSDESSMILMYNLTIYNTYDSYTFCNPDEIRPKLENYKSGDVLVVKGKIFWDCNYVIQVSNNPYTSYNYGRAYNIYVTDIYMDLYGKDKNEKGAE